MFDGCHCEGDEFVAIQLCEIGSNKAAIWKSFADSISSKISLLWKKDCRRSTNDPRKRCESSG